MDKQTCQRCELKEYIPTHQYVKIEEMKYTLCTSCWEMFNSWLYGSAIKEPRPKLGTPHESGLVYGKEPSKDISTGREPRKVMTLKKEIAGQLEMWLSAAHKDDMEGLITQ